MIDTSGSMAGDRIATVNEAMHECEDVLREKAGETPDAEIKISALKFSSGAQWVTKSGLVSLEDFYWNDVSAGGVTDLGAALKELEAKMSRSNFLVSDTGFCVPVIIFMRTHAYYRGLLCYACENGIPALEEYLAEDLKKLSEKGSADDITVSGMMDVEKVRPFLAEFEGRNLLVEKEERLAALDHKVNSVREGGRFQYLHKAYQDAQAAHAAAEKNYKDAVKKYREAEGGHRQVQRRYKKVTAKPKSRVSVQRRGRSIVQSREQRIKKEAADARIILNAEKDRLRKAEKARKDAEKEYQSYKDRYESIVRERDKAKEELEYLKAQNEKDSIGMTEQMMV